MMYIPKGPFNNYHPENIIFVEEAENEEFYFFEFLFGNSLAVWQIDKETCGDEDGAREFAKEEYVKTLRKMKTGNQWPA